MRVPAPLLRAPVGSRPGGWPACLPAGARAVRGFNGDIARHLQQWTVDLDSGAEVPRLGTRIARKTLLAVAGIVSVRDETWSTDRRACAVRWNELKPGVPLDTLVAWLDSPPSDRATVRRMLEGPVARVVQAFESEIGLWTATGSDG